MTLGIPSYIQLNISLFILLGLGITAAGIGYLFYRRTMPPLAQGWRITLGALRAFAVFLVLLLFFAPEVTLEWVYDQPRRIALLIDRSASMGISDSNGSARIGRAVQAAAVISDEIGSRAGLVRYAFDTDTVLLGEQSPDTTSFATDISAAIGKISATGKYDAFILISDGNYSRGANPLFEERLRDRPVYTVGVGDTIQDVDIVLSGVRMDNIIYQNKVSAVAGEILLRGNGSYETNVRLRENGKVIAARRVTVQAGTTVPVKFEVTPQKAGLVTYTLEADKIEGETVVENNRYQVTAEVLRDKLHVAVLAPEPSVEAKFMALLLDEFEDIIVHRSVLRKGGGYFFEPAQKTIDSADVLILVDLARRNIPENLKTQIQRRVGEKQVPVLAVTGANARELDQAFIRGFFPIEKIRDYGQMEQLQARRTVTGQLNPVINIYPSGSENEQFWRACPPLDYPWAEIGPGAGVRVLLESSGKAAGLPVLAVHQAGGRKSAMLFGRGFWRWHFMLSTDDRFNDGWGQVLHNLMRWLASSSGGKQVIASLADKTVPVGSPLDISAQVFDAAFQKVRDALVRAEVNSPSGKFEMELRPGAEGVYVESLVPQVTGRYRVNISAWQNDNLLDSDEVEFAVTRVNAEFLVTRQDSELLRELARNSGGAYITVTNAAGLVDQIDLEPVRQYENYSIELWNNLYFLLFIITLFAIEWFIRKRLGLA